jgi:hypothetical protein
MLLMFQVVIRMPAPSAQPVDGLVFAPGRAARPV